MSNLTKIMIPVVLLFLVYMYFAFSPSDDIGSFDKIRSAGEINQPVNVYVVQTKGFNRDANNNIISFYVRDKYDEEAVVNLSEPAPPEIVNADVIELLGHMHGSTFIAKSAEVKKLKE